MRLLANENVPGLLVRALVDSGCDVSWVRTASPGASDREVLALAIQEERILLTFDKDFGEIARLAVLILSRNDWAGRFSVVEPGRIRSRPLEIQ